jgi:hypothetical protein
MTAVAQLLAGALMRETSKVMIQTKRDTLVLQVGGWAWGWQPHPVKLGFVSKPQLKPRKRKKVGEAIAQKRAETPQKK